MPKLSIVDSPALSDVALVHWMQLEVAVGTLMYILNSSPDLTHSVHQVACCFVHYPGQAHVKALDHISRFWLGLAIFVRFLLTGPLLIVDFCWNFILLLMPVTKTWNWIVVELLELACLPLVPFCLLDHLYRISVPAVAISQGPTIVRVQSTLTALWLWRVITFNVGGLLLTLVYSRADC